MILSHVARTVAVCATLACGAALPAFAQTPAAPATAPATAPAKPTTPAPAAATSPAPTSSATAAATSGKHVTGKVNINTATASELDALPNVGEKRSAAIIKGRPYKSTDELVSKKVLSKGVFDGIRKHITI